jgi:hypothetical protein
MTTRNANDGVAFTANGNVICNNTEDGVRAIILAINGYSISNMGIKSHCIKR